MPINAPIQEHVLLCPRSITAEPIHPVAKRATHVIGICLHNQQKTIANALASAMRQSVFQDGRAVVVILDDHSDDDWRDAIKPFLQDQQIILLRGNCGSATHARNGLLDWVDANLPAARWVIRLDADDLLMDPDAVSILTQAGDESCADYILGSNVLRVNGEVFDPGNGIADPRWLTDPELLLAYIEDFCTGKSVRELPSCNLIIRTHTQIRYPHIASAEDHWLVARLLLLEPQRGIIVPQPLLSAYSLNGNVTTHNRKSSRWQESRTRLAYATRLWHELLNTPGIEWLGVGMEGVVWRNADRIFKQFYPWAMDADYARQIEKATRSGGPVPSAQWYQNDNGAWICTYADFASSPWSSSVTLASITQYLLSLLAHRFITANITRSNFRVLPSGELIYIDVGKDIRPFSTSFFLDIAARLFAIGVLDLPDGEWARRKSFLSQHEVLASLPGFFAFFRQLIETSYPHVQIDAYPAAIPPKRKAADITLLLKACAQDAEFLDVQVRHIVSQLSYPASFASRVLLIDPHPGPFLRQYAEPNLEKLLQSTEQLRRSGWIDEIWIAPTDTETIRNTYERWFGNRTVTESHGKYGVPLFPQIWAFDRISTPYVFQCDMDVLIGRRDFEHDFLADMHSAAQSPGVLSVGMNIPQSSAKPVAYHGEPGQYPPEIRCGLLSLQRIFSLLPLFNPIWKGKQVLMWHRSLQIAQKDSAFRSVRGGDPRSYYIHPKNANKNLDLSIIRDLMGQGREPAIQHGHWDLVPSLQWRYPTRSERLVFLLKGKDTGLQKLHRCFRSLSLQKDQSFGVIVIDDGSSPDQSWHLPLLLGDLFPRTTLIRRERRHGYIPNFLLAAETICTCPNTLLVTVDLDDALLSPFVSERLLQVQAEGADLVNAPMFRPDKPLHEYPPNYQNARATGGGNVWAHLRGFRISLFRALPKAA